MTIDTGYPVYPAAVFPEHPEWPVYEAPARWYIQQGKISISTTTQR